VEVGLASPFNGFHCLPAGQSLPLALRVIPPATALASVSLLATTTSTSYMSAPPMPATTLSWSLPQSLPSTLLPMPPTALVAPSHGLPPHSGFSLSPGSEPFPRNLVEKIRSGQFVDMRELLRDNITLTQQLEVLGGQSVPALPGVLRPRLREVTSISSWMYCFMAYIAIRAGNVDDTRDKLAYARLILRESLRHSGRGWIDYDRVFRQQAALDNTMSWNTLHPGIQAATLLGQSGSPSSLCTICRELDHSAANCAMAYLEPPRSQLICTQPSATPENSRQPVKRQGPFHDVCHSWNKGACIYPATCTYRHICAICHQRHMARNCPRSTADAKDRPTPFSKQPATQPREWRGQ
jgi:hypothetical protein